MTTENEEQIEQEVPAVAAPPVIVSACWIDRARSLLEVMTGEGPKIVASGDELFARASAELVTIRPAQSIAHPDRPGEKQPSPDLYTVASAAYANADNTAMVIQTPECGAVLVSAADTPALWEKASAGAVARYKPPAG